MLNAYPSAEAPIWIDLLDPTPEEAAKVGEHAGVAPPDRAALSEIESTSRLRAEGQALMMSMPIVLRDDAGSPTALPLGFILTPKSLTTIRYAPMPSFDAAAKAYAAEEAPGQSSIQAFCGLAEEMVDRLADVLEHIGARLGKLSGAAFSEKPIADSRADRSRGGLREQMRLVGRLGDQTSDIRDALLALGRIVGFVGQRTAAWKVERPVDRLESLRQDIASLTEYEEHLSGKVQFLLDALVGMIGIAQNEIFKVLTIVSIAGIPPTLIASIYGMNFKGMPELSWTYGYPYGLTMIVLSALLPLAWFRWRGWF